MRKYLAILCATMLCVCCLALAACGGSSSSASASASASGASESAAASESSSSAAADPKENFVGDWKIAAAEYQGVTVAGDFTSLLGDDSSMMFTFKEDGTGSATMGDDTHNLTWELKGDTAISMKVEEQDTAQEATYENGALFLTMKDNDFEGTIILSKDGAYEGARVISTADATAITSEDALVGDWSLSGINMAGMSMYGDKEALEQAMGGSTDVTMSFKAGGAATVMGQDAEWKVDADGAAITLSGVSIPVKALGDDIMMDMSDMIGMDIVMVYSK